MDCIGGMVSGGTLEAESAWLTCLYDVLLVVTVHTVTRDGNNGGKA